MASQAFASTSSVAAGRLVVTGHTPDGEAVFVQDSAPRPVELNGPGVQARFLWARDDLASFPDSGARPTVGAGQPPPGGCRAATLHIAAGANAEYHQFVVAALGELAEPENPGFHTTPTLDFVQVLAGEVLLELDHDARRLAAGDTVVLNGVRHRFTNPGAETAVLLAVQIGAYDSRQVRR
jgi:quercetin dioxygenase-like cupin family protein